MNYSRRPYHCTIMVAILLLICVIPEANSAFIPRHITTLCDSVWNDTVWTIYSDSANSNMFDGNYGWKASRDHNVLWCMARSTNPYLYKEIVESGDGGVTWNRIRKTANHITDYGTLASMWSAGASGISVSLTRSDGGAYFNWLTYPVTDTGLIGPDILINSDSWVSASVTNADILSDSSVFAIAYEEEAASDSILWYHSTNAFSSIDLSGYINTVKDTLWCQMMMANGIPIIVAMVQNHGWYYWIWDANYNNFLGQPDSLIESDNTNGSGAHHYSWNCNYLDGKIHLVWERRPFDAVRDTIFHKYQDDLGNWTSDIASCDTGHQSANNFLRPKTSSLSHHLFMFYNTDKRVVKVWNPNCGWSDSMMINDVADLVSYGIETTPFTPSDKNDWVAFWYKSGPPASTGSMKFSKIHYKSFEYVPPGTVFCRTKCRKI